MSRGRIRQTLEDQINGDRDKFDTDTEKATLRGLRGLADSLDQIEARIDRTAKSMFAVASTVGGGIITAAIIAAFRLS